ncbi:hypothetical protein CcaverHIS641_0402440 [Cutaneotrichosporon cavernicola]|nr:hypothetical protein CcaverHIS641_0402440 [Cutaneotrichosporon cavernicola]
MEEPELEPTHLYVPPNSATSGGGISIISRLVPQAQALIAHLKALGGNRGVQILAALSALSDVPFDFSVVNCQPCVACFRFDSDQLCIRTPRGPCAWCLGIGHECYFPDSSLPLPLEEPDNAAQLLDKVITRALENMRSEARDYAWAHLQQLVPILPAIADDMAHDMSDESVEEWAHDFEMRMADYIPTIVQDALENHEKKYRTTLGPYALAIVRAFMWKGAESVDDLEHVVQGVGNSFRQMWEEDGPKLVQMLARQDLEETLEEESDCETESDFETLTSISEVVGNEMSVSGQEAMQKHIASLPGIKETAEETALSQATMTPGLAWLWERDIIQKIKHKFKERVPTLGLDHVSSWTAQGRERTALLIPASKAGPVTTLSFFSSLVLQAKDLMGLLGVRNDECDHDIFAALQILSAAQTDRTMVGLHEQCTHCRNSAQYCVRSSVGKCARCLAYQHDCSDYQNDHADTVCCDVIMKAIEQLGAGTNEYIDVRIAFLESRFPSLVAQVGRMAQQTSELVKDYMRMRAPNRISNRLERMLPRHISLYSATNGVDVLAVIRREVGQGMWNGESCRLMASLAANALGAMRDKETPEMDEDLEKHALFLLSVTRRIDLENSTRGALNANIRNEQRDSQVIAPQSAGVENGAMEPRGSADPIANPIPLAPATEESMQAMEAAKEKILYRLPAIKCGVATLVLEERPHSLAKKWEKDHIYLVLNPWAWPIRQALLSAPYGHLGLDAWGMGGRTISAADVSAFTDELEKKLVEDAKRVARDGVKACVTIPIPANRIVAGTGVCVISLLAPQATQLIALFGQSQLRDRNILEALNTLSSIDKCPGMIRTAKYLCNRCCSVNGICVRPSGAKCTLCLVNGKECVGYKRDPEDVLLEKAIAHVQILMDGKILAMQRLVINLTPRLVDLLCQAMSPVGGHTHPIGYVEKVTRHLFESLRAHFRKEVKDAVHRHIMRYCLASSFQSLAYIRKRIEQGVSGIEHLGPLVEHIRSNIGPACYKECVEMQTWIEPFAKDWMEGYRRCEQIKRGARPQDADPVVEAAISDTGEQAVGAPDTTLESQVPGGMNHLQSQATQRTDIAYAENSEVSLNHTVVPAPAQSGDMDQDLAATLNSAPNAAEPSTAAATQNFGVQVSENDAHAVPTAASKPGQSGDVTHDSATPLNPPSNAREPSLAPTENDAAPQATNMAADTDLPLKVKNEVLAELPSQDAKAIRDFLNGQMDKWVKDARRVLAARMSFNSIPQWSEEHLKEQGMMRAQGAVQHWRKLRRGG